MTDERLEQLPDSEQTKVARWQERSKVHNPNLTTIERQLQAVGADRVIDGEEHVYLCSVQQQWEQQLTALLAYIDDYEQVEPEFVAANQAMFTAWEQDARSTQEVVLEIGPTCP